MFTGLIQTVGMLRSAQQGLVIRPNQTASTLSPFCLGDSIAVDGVCLTVAELLEGDTGFRADVSEETLSRTTLADKAAAGEWVNLELALRLCDRLGGHLVSGHVDGLGIVQEIRQETYSWSLRVAWKDPSLGRYICDKASVAVDGISLTVAGCEPNGDQFWLAVIPQTWTSTTLYRRQPGDVVNLEADLLAKYTERLLTFNQLAHQGNASFATTTITSEWMAQQGWS